MTLDFEINIAKQIIKAQSCNSVLCEECPFYRVSSILEYGSKEKCLANLYNTGVHIGFIKDWVKNRLREME